MSARASVWSAGAAALAVVVACKGKQPAPAAVLGDGGVVVSAEARAYARSLFALRCAACHGPTGLGEARTGVKMPSFQDPAWQSGVSDEAIERIIAEGGQRVGKSPVMPPNPDLAGNPEALAALRLHVRAFGGR